MTRYLSNRDGGKTDEAGHLRFLNSMTVGDVFSGGAVTQSGTPNMSVQVAALDAIIRDSANGYAYHVWSTTTETVTIATANSSNPRKDYIIAYVDKGVTPSSATANNPSIWKLISVAGTPAGSPAVPSVAQIQASAVGTNPYIILATVTVATSTTTITNGAILDSRTLASSSRVGYEQIDFSTSSENFKTQEVATPYKWVDGKTIYKKTYNLGAIPSAGNGTTTPYGISGTIDKTIRIDSFFYGSAGSYPIPMFSTTSGSTLVTISTDTNGVKLYCNVNVPGSAFATLYYTKV